MGYTPSMDKKIRAYEEITKTINSDQLKSMSMSELMNLRNSLLTESIESPNALWLQGWERNLMRINSEIERINNRTTSRRFMVTIFLSLLILGLGSANFFYHKGSSESVPPPLPAIEAQ
jgi:hypothetical protein